ncbi:hypothetical protein SNE25_29340 [Mucilaginibacter sabulilitoris]|uniref:Transporter n=1 Tax=Mucilaginibacter sabulilitoris TaxID=1173583 RepID=A0ABZ0TMM4_9SPHI|nr:hypothetical protein [Mucilaginibacter sabulilitoris]WPU93428.1 hypothetical protein SNE25_29340 [Mucilaginibacter sabulilitoris]
MIFKSTFYKFLFAALVLIIAAQSKSYAGGGFPVRPGRLTLSPSVSYFFANKQWDSHSVKGPFPDNGRFSSLSTSLYAEYGLSRRFTLSALMPYAYNTYKDNTGDYKDSGFGDAEIGIRYYLANINYKYYFSLQATAIIPMYTNLALGYNQKGAELRLAFAGSGHLFGKNSYFILENGVREYFGYESVFQDRYNATYGITLDKKFREQLSVSVGGFYVSSNNKAFSPNPNTSKNFAFNQVSLSYGHSFSKKVAMFLTGGTFITGRNTGAGSSITASLNYHIDTK